MRKFSLFLLGTAMVTSSPLLAAEKDKLTKPDAQPGSGKSFSTGVAKGRDLLDSAISASSFEGTDLVKLGVTDVASIVGNIPGIRVESSGTDGNFAMTVRGLPLAATGAKYIQLQEDGLPVLEFGDVNWGGSTVFLRSDLTVSQLQAIRGGSASTFASNAPGGAINLISNTGEKTGGMIQLSAGLDHDLNRLDFNYGSPLGKDWRFNIGGYYHSGEGVRAIGYNAVKGGQIKFNITRQFANGYVRLYLKYLDDSQPNYAYMPMSVSGTNASPVYSTIAGADIVHGFTLSPATASYVAMSQNNTPTQVDQRDGIRGISKAVGLEAQFDVGGWTISDRFRFASNSGVYNETGNNFTTSAGMLATMIGGSGATLSYATGPNAGQIVTNPATLGGNGLATVALHISNRLNDLGNFTNDLRASRVWSIKAGKLTTTAGLYTSSQNIGQYWNMVNTLETVQTGGNAVRLNLTTASGVPVTQSGMLAYGFAILPPATFHYLLDVNYRTMAPYASANYQIGKLALGGSLRLDTGRVNGTLYGADLGGGRNGVISYDMNGNGVISPTETQVAVLPLEQPGLVRYNYHYVSYSVGANYRLAEPLSVFARYSRGARAGADRLLFLPSQNSATGGLTDPSFAYGPVKQAELGVKLRRRNLELYVTGFWASTNDSNVQLAANAQGALMPQMIQRTYSAKGVELEGEYRHGPFSLSVGATYASARIDKDLLNPAMVGKEPRHQPALMFNLRPQYQNRLVTVGATVNGVTQSYAQDANELIQPGYTIVSPFVFVRPYKGVQLGLTVYNVFDKMALIDVGASAIPTNGIITARTLNGRNVRVQARFSF